MKFLAIDIGASGGKAFTGEIKGGKLAFNEIRRFPNGFIEDGGRRRWDIQRIFDEVIACIGMVPNADSIGINTWGVDYGWIKPDGSLADLPFAYRDSRTAKSISAVHEKIQFDKLYSITGIQHLPFNTLYQIADDLETNPDLVKSSEKLLMMPELIGFMLTGKMVSEYTNASTSGMMDAINREWSDEILNAIGLPDEKLAEIEMPGEIKVPLRREIAEKTGSKASFVFTACHDTASAVAGIGASGSDWAFLSSGTWSLIGREIEKPILTDEARDANFTNEGGVGGKTRFLKNVTGLWIVQELQRIWKEDGYDRSIEAICMDAAKAVAFHSYINPDDPMFIAPDDMTIAVADFRTRTKQPIPEGMGGVARCVFESLALAYRRVFSKLEDITESRIHRLHVVGGGSLNALLCQMTADACNVPLVAGPANATAVGNIIVQAVCQGILKDINEGRKLVADSFETVEYLPSADERWIEAAGKFESFFNGVSQVHSSLNHTGPI